jgi:EmrB/QacA subfamily drug resistance transporter
MENRILSPLEARILPWLVAVAFFMQTLDATILNTALPAMADSLHTNALQMQAVVISYMLTVALLIPASGWMTDRFGIRRVFMAAILVFTLGSLLCALSPSLPLITAARVVQGIGGALLAPVGRLSILKAYPREDLVSVLSFITIPGLIGPLLGPTLGGFLVKYATWHWIFLLNIPVGLLGAFATLRFMPELPKPTKPEPFDRLGFALFGVAMIAVTMAFEGVGELGLALTPMVLLFIFGIVCLVAYCLHSLRAQYPLFNPEMFQIRNFTVGILGNLFARLGNGAMPFLTPLLLQVGLGFSPLKSGLTMIPMTLGAMLAKSIVRPLLNTIGYRGLLVANTLSLGLLIAAFSLIDRETPYLWLMILFSVFGVINSMQFTAMNTLTLIDIPQQHAAGGNGMLSVVMQVSMGMGVACAAAILGEFSGLRTVPPPADLLEAFHKTYICLGFLAALSAAIFFHARHSDGKHAESSGH